MINKDLEKEIKKCKQCKLDLKKYRHYCEKHITLNHIGMLIVSGTKSQDKHPTKKKLRATESFTKAIALGIEFLIRNRKCGYRPQTCQRTECVYHKEHKISKSKEE